MDSRQLTEARIVYKLNPVGQWRTDQRFAKLALVTALVQGNRRAKLGQLLQFFDGFWQQRPEEMTEEELDAAFERLAALYDQKGAEHDPEVGEEG